MEEELDEAAHIRSRSSRHQRSGWGLAAIAISALVFAVLPEDRIRLGESQLQGLVGSYLYGAPQSLTNSPSLGYLSGLTVDEIYLPGRLRLVWADMGASYDFDGYHYQLDRLDTATGTVLHTQQLWDYVWEETVDFSTTSVFEYQVRLVPNYAGSAGPWSQLRFHVEDVEASANQTVDSRYDLRYGNPTPLDFQFGSRTYRGGLFVGFANDPSRVARSFLKFPIPAGVQDGVYFTGSVNAYATTLLTSQSVEVGAQKTTDASWNASTLKWTTAPTIDPGDAPRRFTFSADGWGHWSLGSDILDAQGETDPLSIALASTGESASGQWVYLAKKEYDPDLAPRVLIAAHHPGEAPAAGNLTVTSKTSSSVSLSWGSPVATGISVLQMRTGTGSWQNVSTGSNAVWFGWGGGGIWVPTTFNETAAGLSSNTQYEFRVKCDTQAYGEYYSQRVITTTP